jgi:predicted nuclease with TOPRIM domain
MTTGTQDGAERTRQELDELRTQIQSLRQEQARLDAALRERTALSDDKLRADIAKIGAEARKIQSDLDPTPNNYQRGIKELAKLDAEKRKLDSELDPVTNNYERGIRELAKLDAERRKLDSELDPVANNYERGIRELAKLDAERRKLDSELDPVANNYERGIKELAKLDAEKAKLDTEKRKLGSDKVSDWVKTIGTILLAAAAIGTWYVTFNKNEQESDTRYRADAARLIESLGAQQPQLRAAAAIGLRSFLGDKRTHGLALGSLAYSLGLETHIDVQQAMADSLVAAGQDAVVLLQQMILRVNSEVQIGLDRLGDIPCHAKELEPINAQQNGMTVAVLALSQLSQRSPKPPPDFSKLNFKCLKLHPLRDRLRGAVFRGATLWNADFYGMDLRGTDFSDGHASEAKFTKAKLERANFSAADLEMADFTAATLDDAQFTGADLDGADFATASGLNEQQLKAAAHLYCAKLPAPLMNVMARELQPPPGMKCQP